MGASDAVHQAIDIAWSVADLLGGLFDDAPRVRRFGIAGPASPLSMSLDLTNNAVVLANDDTSGNLQGFVTACQPANGALMSTTVPVASGASGVAFTQYPNYTKGLLTASVVDTSASSNPSLPSAPLLGLTARSFYSAQNVDLGPYCQFTLDPVNSQIVLTSSDPTNTYTGEFRLTTAVPRETFEVDGTVTPGGTTNIPFPEPLGSSVIDQIDVQLWGPPQAAVAMANSLGG